jgi:hypothetical protein
MTMHHFAQVNIFLGIGIDNDKYKWTRFYNDIEYCYPYPVNDLSWSWKKIIPYFKIQRIWFSVSFCFCAQYVFCSNFNYSNF